MQQWVQSDCSRLTASQTICLLDASLSAPVSEEVLSVQPSSVPCLVRTPGVVALEQPATASCLRCETESDALLPSSCAEYQQYVTAFVSAPLRGLFQEGLHAK